MAHWFLGRRREHSHFAGLLSAQTRRHALLLHLLGLLDFHLFVILTLGCILIEEKGLDFDALAFLAWEQPTASTFLLHRVGRLVEVEFAVFLFVLQFPHQLALFELLLALADGHDATEVVEQLLGVDIGDSGLRLGHRHVGRLGSFEIAMESDLALLDRRLDGVAVAVVGQVQKILEIHRELHYS